MKKIKKKIITIVCLLIIVPLCLSLLIRPFGGSATLIEPDEEILDSESPGDDEEPEVFVPELILPDSFVVLREDPCPLNEKVYNNLNDNDRVSVVEQAIGPEVIPTASKIFNQEKSSISGAEVRMYLAADNSKIFLYDYDFIEIKFDVFNDESFDLMNALKCQYHFIGLKDASTTGIVVDCSKSFIKLNPEDSLEFQISNNFNKTFTDFGAAFTVRYVFAIDREDTTASRMQMYVNDVLYVDTYGFNEPIFSEDMCYLHYMRFNRIGPYSGQLMVSNLVVKGYTQ